MIIHAFLIMCIRVYLKDINRRDIIEMSTVNITRGKGGS